MHADHGAASNASPAASPRSARGRSLGVLAEGDGWLVVAKPPRLVVHRSEFTRHAPAVLQRLRKQLGKPVYLVHRLDAAASGCLLVATDPELVAPLASALSEGTKTYVALVRGVCRGPQTVLVDRPLLDDNGILKEARTRFTCLASSEDPRCSLVEAELLTGRLHQIRRHIRGLSHPILGDRAHGDKKENRWWKEHYGVGRLFLHALRLEFTLPDGQDVQAHCPLFGDMEHVVRRLPFWEQVRERLAAP